MLPVFLEEGAIKNRQSRKTGNIGYIRQRQTKQGAIKNGQSRKTGNIGYIRQRQTKQKTQHRKLKI
jgi:hypothetical protein